MCGIAGIINIDSRAVDVETLKNMTRLVTYRGPDDEGYYFKENIGLGHRRLSIIDLSPAGHQPMSNEDGSLWIVYNGEIYNFIEIRKELEIMGYNFKSNSDTEVILKAYEEWGENCLDKLNGMFAFTILDLRKERLFCARDRIGIKPFYYYFDGQRFIFASEIKQILENREVSRIPDIEAVADYLSFQYVLGDRTFFKRIEKLLPGHYLIFDISCGELRRFCYWDLDFEPDYSRKEEDYIEELRYLLEDSVRLQLRSDVPLGCHLSGGIDSSIVTCLASRLSPNRIKTFTGKFDLGEDYDESKWAKIVSNYANTEYIEIIPDISSFKDLLPKIIWYLDEPVVGPGVLPQYLVSELASKKVKVVLGGQGGDELFGGYNWYNNAILMYIINNFNPKNNIFQNQSSLLFLVDFIRFKGVKPFLGVMKRFSPGKTFEEIYADLWCAITDKELEALINDNINYSPKERFIEEFRKLNAKNPFTAMFKFDLRNYLQGLLQVEDRVSMAVSLESRVPLLDHRIVELASKLPLELKIRNNENKHLLRKAVSGIIPKEIIERKDKKGFPTPIDSILKDANVFIKNNIYSSIINHKYIQRICSQNIRRTRHNFLAYKIINILLWEKHYCE